MEKVSIVMPAYNAEKFIKSTIDSVLKQSYTNFELIVVNDGSTDSTSDICHSFNDKRLKIIDIDNCGVSNARNLGIEKSTGKYMMFIDSDDYYDNDYVSEAIENISGDYELVVFGYNKIFSSQIKKNIISKNINNLPKYKFIEELQKTSNFNMLWNKVYVTDIIKNNKIIFDTEIFRGEDYKFNIDYINKVNKYLYIPISFYNYRIIEGGLATKYDSNEFTRRINNIKYNEEMYLKNNYPMDYIYEKYIAAVEETLGLLIKCKTNSKKLKHLVKEMVCYNKIVHISNLEFKQNSRLSIVFKYLIKKKKINCLIFLAKLKFTIKKILGSR